MRITSKSTTLQNSARHAIIKMPVATNTRSLKAGEPLFLYKAKESSAPSDPKPIDSKRLFKAALASQSAAHEGPRKRLRRLPGDVASDAQNAPRGDTEAKQPDDKTRDKKDAKAE